MLVVVKHLAHLLLVVEHVVHYMLVVVHLLALKILNKTYSFWAKVCLN